MLCSGILLKQGAVVKTWRERYFTLDSSSLGYYDVPTTVGAFPTGSARGVIPVSSLRDVQVGGSANTDGGGAFRIVFDAAAALDTYGVSSTGAGGTREVVLLAPSDTERAKWVAALSSVAFSPARAVLALREVTAAWRAGRICSREWEMARALIAAGTEDSLKAAARVIDAGRVRGARMRAGDALESLLLDFSLAHSESALLGVLAGIRRVASSAPIPRAARERLVEIAVCKYGDGTGIAASGQPAAGDGIAAAVARGWSGHAWSGSGDSDDDTRDAWTPIVQEAFALVLHVVAASVQRAALARRKVKRATATATAATSTSVESTLEAESVFTSAVMPPSPVAATRPRRLSRAATMSRVSSTTRLSRDESRYNAGMDAIELLLEETGLLADLNLVNEVGLDGDGGGIEEEDEDEDDEEDEGWSEPEEADAAAAALAQSQLGMLSDLSEEGLFADSYDLGARLGEGAYSLVFRARHRASGLEVAVKVAAKERMSENDRKRLVEEVAIMARLDHPHILALFAFYDEPAAYYIVMELCLGGELFDRIVNASTYSEAAARDTLSSLAQTVSYLHERGVAHRDLKPENILLSSSDPATSMIKLGDLGFAKKVPLIGLSTSCGTPSYVAPEILKGEPYGLPCDIWSLGVILYILLCGYAPFSSANQSDLFRMIVSGKFVFDAPYWDKVSTPAKELIRRLIVVAPDKRATAAELMAHPWLNGNVSTAELTTARTAMRVFNEARRRVVKRGELVKQGQVVRSWKRRVFILTPDALSYYDAADIEAAGGKVAPEPPSSAGLTESVFAFLGISGGAAPTLGARPKGMIALADVVSVEPCTLDAATLAGAGVGMGGGAGLRVRGPASRELIAIAQDAKARSEWIAAISATKAHGDLVSKAWTALGGDYGAEVVQLMSLAKDWEDLILVGVIPDAVATSSSSPLPVSEVGSATVTATSDSSNDSSSTVSKSTITRGKSEGDVSLSPRMAPAPAASLPPAVADAKAILTTPKIRAVLRAELEASSGAARRGKSSLSLPPLSPRLEAAVATPTATLSSPQSPLLIVQQPPPQSPPPTSITAEMIASGAAAAAAAAAAGDGVANTTVMKEAPLALPPVDIVADGGGMSGRESPKTLSHSLSGIDRRRAWETATPPPAQ